MSEVGYSFELPSNQRSIIKVIGVGGGGSNAVNHMNTQGIKDVEFVVCNTDVQALESSTVAKKLQLGFNLTEGLGAGANPEVGRNAAIESKEDIREMFGNDTKMVFITAGMGGGTGTGAAPVIAQIAKELGVLTVGIVTAPFSFEGRKKLRASEQGIKELKDNCDTVLVILNDKLREVYGNLSIRSAFSHADNVLSTAAKSIAEIITVNSEMNVDFEDVRTIMKDSGTAVMGSALVSGENRAARAAEMALSSPLLNNTDIKGAQKILLSLNYGEDAELTMDELSEITDYIEAKAGFETDELILGQGLDTSLEDQIRVTIIATGFTQAEKELPQRVYDLDSNQVLSEPTVKSEINAPAAPSEPVLMERKEEKDETPVEESQKPAKPQPEEEEVRVYTLDGGYEVTDEEETEAVDDGPLFSQSKPTNNYLSPEDEMRRKQMIEKSKQRIHQLQGMKQDIDEFKNKLDVPAYIRRGKRMQDLPASDESNISRYNLSDDNEILGNNKFLHDNVD